jgi:hypothetical protein
VLEVLGQIDHEAAIRLAVQALAADSLNLAKPAKDLLRKFAEQHPQSVVQLFGEALLDPSVGWRLELSRLRSLVSTLPTEMVKHWLDAHGRPAAVALAHHLPLPHLDDAGSPVVPELAAYVLDRYAEDEQVFRAFCVGLHNGQMYSGDIAAEHEREGEVARRFLDHPLPRIREWAQYEIDRAAHEADWWRVRDEEMAVP